MTRCNCLVFAWRLWITRGGYVAVRRSRHVPGWHWLWSPDLRRWLHYEPVAPMRGWRAALHKVWYRGRICRSD